VSASLVRAQQHVDEYRLKAAVLYNLAKFVDWPPESFTDPMSPMVFCVLGVDPFGSALDDTLRGHAIGRRFAVVKRVADVESDCHVLFVANSEVRRLPALIEQLRNRSVLTIGDTGGFADMGGMIGLVTDADRVRFAINPVAAERGRLKISARVMALASAVIRAGDPAR
jgi:hypothetical protein